MRLPEEVGLVTTFLTGDVGRHGEGQYLSAIDSVLQDKQPYSEAGGNAYRLEINKDFTRIINTLVDENDEEYEECTIETTELRELIKIWSEIINNPPPSPEQQEQADLMPYRHNIRHLATTHEPNKLLQRQFYNIYKLFFRGSIIHLASLLLRWFFYLQKMLEDSQYLPSLAIRIDFPSFPFFSQSTLKVLWYAKSGNTRFQW